MPILSGLDAVKMIRDIEKKEKREHIPVIAVTAFALDGNRETCLDAGCDDYIAKPYDRKILIEILNKYSSQ
jgi:CheY-like chemotaxis protein